MSGKDVLSTIKEKSVKFVDFRFCDTRGKEQHVTVPALTVDERLFVTGKMFYGLSLARLKGLNEYDLILIPGAGSAFFYPFF